MIGITNPNVDVDKSLQSLVAKSINTVYQAQTDGEIMFTIQMGNQGTAYLKVGTSTPPATVIAEIHGDWGNGIIPCSRLIKAGEYYNIEYAGAGTIRNVYWRPIQ